MIFINLRIEGQSLDFNKINSAFQFGDRIIHKTGEIYEENEEQTIFDKDIWTTRIEISDNNCFEEEVEKIVNQLYVEKTFIRKLSDSNEVSLWITVYAESYQHNLHFSAATIGKIHEMRIDVDLSLMFLNEFYNRFDCF